MVIGVVCGGFSSEFDISIKSGDTIVRNFPKEHHVVKIVLSKTECKAEWNNEWYPFDLNSASFAATDGLKKMDFVIIYTHGDPGENGKLQALFDIYGVKYINSNALASELSFDKWYCNQFLKNFDVPIAKSKLLLRNDVYDVNEIINKLGLPVFVKPCDSGSSFGISRVNQLADLEPAIQKARAEGNSLVIESFLDGTEVTCGVYNTVDGPVALPLAEIVSENEFFDYEAKYLGKSQEIVPARISEEATKKVQELAVKIYQLMRLRSISRIDFMLVNNAPYLIEVNTTPGFTEESIVPRMLKSQNKTITEFWREIVAFETKLQ
jgi:D-alanine-D-alanine ligase